MLIKAYGLFWRADEVDWTPGRGGWQLLGRRGERRPRLQIADFAAQSGLYILYGNYGPHYVGLTETDRLGRRLKAHLTDQHANKWDRFSWFGFRQVLTRKQPDGLNEGLLLFPWVTSRASGERRAEASEGEHGQGDDRLG